MKVNTIFIQYLFLCQMCFSTATKEHVPAWVIDWKSVFPDSAYIAQHGTGKSAKLAQTDALSAITRYLKSEIQATLSTSISTSGGVESVETQDDVFISSQLELFGIEFTNPFYHKKQKKYYCIAFINRAQAWTQYQPVIEQEKVTFYSFFNKALENPNLLERVKDYKNAYNAGHELLNTLSFGRMLNPIAERGYKNDRENVALIPQLVASAVQQSSLWLDISQDYENRIKNAVSSQLTEYGFTIVNQKSSALYTVKVVVDTNPTYSDEIYSIYPELSIAIIWQDTKSIFEYSCSKGKTAAYSETRVLKNGFSLLAEDINQNLKTKLSESFGF